MDAPLIQVGGSIDEKSAAALTKIITAVFDSAFKNHMEQDTVRAALQAISATVTANNTSISSCILTGEKNQS